MSNRSIRIKTTPGGEDKYIKVKLEQEIDHFEILSLKISQKDLYGSYNSDFGVLIGRVICNGGIGVPNAKISIFIPISDDDKTNAAIVAAYPYSTPRDKSNVGVRYNLLPRVSTNNPFNIPGEYSPKLPVGNFPTKEEITTNETLMEVYEKYYKYTTVTNPSGDYMIYGVPIGVQTVHLSVDITDIGKYSMTVPSMISQLGYSPNLFTDNGTKIKFSTDLDTLPNIETQEISVDVKPFWGDDSTFQIGLTRQDFRIKSVLVGSFVVFGAGFTDGENSAWAKDYESGVQVQEFYRIQDDGNINTSISSKRISTVIKEQVFYYPETVTDADIASGNVNTSTDIKQLFPNQYSKFNEAGQFAYVLPCNRRKIITDELGNEIVVDNNDPNGIFTEFKGFMTFEYSDFSELPVNTSTEIDGRPIRVKRLKYKFPQKATADQCLNRGDNAPTEAYNEIWRKQYYTFKAGELYSVAKYHTLEYVKNNSDPLNGIDLLDREVYNNVGVIVTGDNGDFPDTNSTYQFPSNGVIPASGSVPGFGSQWMNFTIHFIQQGYINRTEGDRRTNAQWTANSDSGYYTNANEQLIGANVKNTDSFARNDRHQTTFINVPKGDVITILSQYPNLKGFRKSSIPLATLSGKYANGNGIDPNNITNGFGGYLGGNSTNPTKDTDFYFYRGFGSADCLEFIKRLGFI